MQYGPVNTSTTCSAPILEELSTSGGSRTAWAQKPVTPCPRLRPKLPAGVRCTMVHHSVLAASAATCIPSEQHAAACAKGAGKIEIAASLGDAPHLTVFMQTFEIACLLGTHTKHDVFLHAPNTSLCYRGELSMEPKACATSSSVCHGTQVNSQAPSSLPT